MNYFKQLLKFYRRLTEQAPANPVAEQQAIALINQAKTSQPGSPIQVGNHPGITLQKSEEGNITINGLFGAKTLTVEDPRGAKGEGYPELIRLLSTTEDQGSAGGQEEEQQQGSPGQPAQPLMAQGNTSAGLVGKTLGSILNLAKKIGEVPVKYLAKKFSTDPYEAGKKGVVVPLLFQLENHTRMVVGQDGKLSVEHGTNQKLLHDIPLAAQEAFEALENLSEDATIEQKEEACNKFKNTFSIVKNEGKNNILIKKSYGDKTEGLLIVDKDSRFADALENAARASTPGCVSKIKTKSSPRKCCVLDEPTNILSMGIGHGNAVNIRGKFMEHFHQFAHLTRTCNTAGTGGNRCTDLIAELTKAYEGDRENLRDAFKSVAAQINENELSIDASDEDSVAFSVLRELFGQDAPKKLLLAIMATTQRGLMRRNPDIVLDVSKTTQFGQRGDVREAWKTREAAQQALREEGIPEEMIDALITKEDISELCAQSSFSNCPPDIKGKKYYTVNISLKNYISIQEKVKMGSISTNTMDKFYELEDPKNTEEANALEKFKLEMGRALGVNLSGKEGKSNFEALQKIKKEVNKLHETIDSLGEKETIAASGKKIKTNTLNEYADTLLSQLRKQEKYEDFVNSDLVGALKDFIKKKGTISGDDLLAFQVEIKQYMKIYLESKMMSNKMKSNDPKIRRNARLFTAATIFLAGGSSDRSTFVANSLSTGKSVTATQNGIMDDTLRDFIDNDEMTDEDIDDMFTSKRGKVIAIKRRGQKGLLIMEQTFARVKDRTASGVKTYVVACDGELLERNSYSPGKVK